MLRVVNPNGTICIPRVILRKLNVQIKDKLDVSINYKNTGIVINKSVRGCIFCNSADDLEIFKKHKVCINCRKNLEKIRKENRKELEKEN